MTSLHAESFCCGIGTSKLLVTYRYAEGSILFDKKKASRGVLSVIAIKTVRLINSQKTFLQTIPLYVDTFNSLWNENDLCIESEARTLAINYLANREDEILNQLGKCGVN